MGIFQDQVNFNRRVLTIACFFALVSCQESSKNETQKDQSDTKQKVTKTPIEYEIADTDLMFEQEKIALISIMMDLPIEKSNAIMRDYLAKTFSLEFDFDNGTAEVYGKLLDTLSSNYDLPKKRIASLIFSYKYEMMTNDDYFEEFQIEYESVIEDRNNDDSGY